MICTQCKKPYLRDASVAVSQGSLFGVCKECRARSGLGSIRSNWVHAATVGILTVEYWMVSLRYQDWRFFLVAVISTVLLFIGLILFVRHSQRVTYGTWVGRKLVGWIQSLGGSVLGLLLGVGWLWVAMHWG